MAEVARKSVIVVGLGKLGLLHAALARALPGLRLVGVVESSDRTRSIAATHLGDIPTFASVEQLPEDLQLDGVVIATPTGTHAALTTWALARGAAVLVEKPLATRASDSRKLLHNAGGSPNRCIVGYMTRFVETFAHARALMATGVLGDVQVVRASMYVEQLLSRGQGWRYQRSESGGGVLITQNSHLIDLLMWLVGPVRRVSGHVHSLVSLDVEDLAHAYFEFDNGAVGFLDTSWSARHHRTATISIEIQGSNGTLDVTDDEVSMYLDETVSDHPSGWRQWRRPDLFSPVPMDIGGPQYSRQLLAFLEVMRGGATIACTLREAHAVQCVIDAIYASAANFGVLTSPIAP